MQPHKQAHEPWMGDIILWDCNDASKKTSPRIEDKGSSDILCGIRFRDQLYQLCNWAVTLFTTGWYAVCKNLLAFCEPGSSSHSSYKLLTRGFSKGSATKTCKWIHNMISKIIYVQLRHDKIYSKNKHKKKIKE